ncbi:gamma-glutamyltransferase [Zobellella sp. DQSA1]|uniref:gamma-glutamyltransferase n=1 Tax=Zobellella sp. DQSA1 TaxID=3342386 RepID=UPI0035BF4119
MPLLLLVLLWNPVTLADTPVPEAAAGWRSNPLVTADEAMVVTANPYASHAARQLLRQGGTAVDAMIAAQAVLALVEPQSSGLGGGAFLVYWQQDEGRLTTLDGRETAPFAAPPDLFLDERGQPLAFMDAVVGGRSVATPGTPMLLWQAHQRFGRLPWRELFAPAITLALNGFTVSPRLARLVAEERESLSRDPQSRAYFFDDAGRPLQAGSTRANPLLAAVLTRLSLEGPSAFYQGEIAAAMVDKVQHANPPGYLGLEDLNDYRVKERPALCAPYRQYQVCGMGPPSSGALALGQILGMLSHVELAQLGPNSPQSWRWIADASRLAFADRNRYIADSDFVPVPVTGLLEPAYLAGRARLIAERSHALQQVLPGLPAPSLGHFASDDSLELAATTHISIVDQEGNALAMTSTIEHGFGSRLMVQGFLLNNELTDFAFSPEHQGAPVANRLEPGKRPRSSMAPTIVLYRDKPLLVIGSPGGSSSIGYVLHALVNVLDWGMDMQEALHQPHLLHRGNVLELEPGGRNQALQAELEQQGFETRLTELHSGLHGIMLHQGRVSASADPRREGIALAAD